MAVDPGALWLRSATGLAAAAQALRRFHTLPGNGKTFDPVADIAQRLRWAGDEERTLSAP